MAEYSKEQQIRNGMIYLIPLIITNLIPFITLPIFTRLLTTEDYGILALSQVYSILITGIVNCGLIIGYERNFFQYNNSEDKRSKLLFSVLIFVCSGLIIFGFITFILRDRLSDWVIGSPGYGNFILLSYCASSTVILKPYFLTYFKNIEDAKSNTKYTIIDSVLFNSISVVLILYFKIGISGILWGQLLSGLFLLTILTKKFLIRFKFSFNWPILKDCLQVSYPFTPRIFMKIISTQIDKYLIGLMNTVGGVGVYNIGQKISMIVFSFMTTLENVFMPQVYKRMFELNESGGKSIGEYLTPFVYISLGVATNIILFSEELVKILTPVSYHEAVDIVIILSMYYGTMFFGKQPQLIFKKKSYISTLLFMFYLVLNITLNIPFIKLWGFHGAAWATFISGLFNVIITFILSQHYYRIVWEYEKLIMIFSLFFISSFTMIIFQQMEIDYYIKVIVKIIYIYLYLYVGILSKVINKENVILAKTTFVSFFKVKSTKIMD